ncbi:LysR family transcriptional regulator [Corynebacterium testudinoris]|uniref:LysR family regulator n=1 Tax=Corynebacterium testudinoris TaxID=136857 RepID=A0A0G3H4K0_9CORY|nr:LysR family transcriptional regulator [Corynebacterium testudinoris]AKK08326.1 hypothetical protein CTEST_04395 [Corynebacterium testudinoris]MBX8995767.1 LysR family transcriptional regulator [Corynebacterium testudinoris]
MLTLSFVTGTEPGKWFERFRERTSHGELRTLDSEDPLTELVDARASLALLRLPDARLAADNDAFHVVTLYEESPGIALPKDSELTLLDTVTPEDIAGEILNYSGAEVAKVREGLQVVAANVGVLIAPRPLIKVLSRKQIEHRDYLADDVPPTSIALVWRKDDDNEAIQDFVGIAKGRTANSSRQATPKRSAREKTLAKQQRRGQVPAKKKAPTRGGRRGRR